MIDRLTIEAQIAQQFGAVLNGGRYMVGNVDVTQGINWMFDTILAERMRLIEPVVEAWTDDPYGLYYEKKRKLKREMPTLHVRLDKLAEQYEELKNDR